MDHVHVDGMRQCLWTAAAVTILETKKDKKKAQGMNAKNIKKKKIFLGKQGWVKEALSHQGNP